MSFLSKLSKLKKTGSSYQAPAPIETSSETPLLPSNYIRDEDPAVRRLKELRRKEQIKNGVNNNKKPKKIRKTNDTKSVHKPKDTDKDIGTIYKRKIGSSSNMVREELPKIKHDSIKKMSFEELMKQADNNATVSSSITEKPSVHIKKSGFKKSTGHSSVKSKSPVPNDIRKKGSEPIRISMPKHKFARPNYKIQERLNERKRGRYDGYHNRHGEEEDDDDGDMDDFIEEDVREAKNEKIGYDREEIWAMFNRNGGRSRDYYDEYGSDDMETNEMDIMEEEEEASRAARREDKREQEWLRRHDEAKAKAKGKTKTKTK